MTIVKKAGKAFVIKVNKGDLLFTTGLGHSLSFNQKGQAATDATRPSGLAWCHRNSSLL
ncbi:hypothetical protein [Amantichitinum ursilacus]|uniref:hypothetical protein n=1 Tax=Amantichitinum ursilacus TaxID=857265 RepID=UPI0013791818|nr:hypothetical protein [Amantichitinum ursilacus]